LARTGAGYAPGMDTPNEPTDPRPDSLGRDPEPEERDHVEPEPLAMDVEDLPKVFPHGDNPAPPATADAPAPG
jgi:hypothetical protein